MNIRRLAVLTLGMMLIGCYTPPRGGVSPAPPGPVDALNIIFRNDYSRLCPEHYDYCRAGKNSICCPRGACCNDGSGPYCCDDRAYDSADRRPYDRPDSDRGPCGSHSTTCSRGGVTICCGADEGCCADREGLYCCAAR